jgi:tRNA-specific 2-thiouridylase
MDFVPNGDYAAFLEAYLRSKGQELVSGRGDLVTSDGVKIGEHAGVHHFTVGQRRGLRVAAREPLYVIATDPASRRVTVGRDRELLSDRAYASGVNWISIADPAEPVRAEVKIRNKHAAAPAKLLPTSNPARVEIRLDEAQRAVTPGQGAVFYSGDLVLGGGWIE